MRDIRFRAWNGSHMLSWGWLCDMGQIGSRFFDKDLSDKGYEIMQYTGLKDRNSVEIYEGDILGKGPYPDPFIVAWHIRGWEAKQIADYDYCWNEHFPLYEVIGNIYENPELIGGE